MSARHAPPLDAAPPRRPSRATLRRLLALARPEARTLALASLFLLLGSSMSLAYPQAFRVIIDEALAARDTRLIDRAALAMAAIFAVQAVAVAVRYYLFSTSGERIVSTLRTRVFGALMAQEVAFFDARRTGELTSRLASDTTVLQSTVSTNVSMGLRNGATVLGGLALLLYTSPRLTLVMLAVVPAVALGAVAYGRRVRRLSKQVQDALAAANEVAEEGLSGIRTVRSFVAEAREVERYGGAVERAFGLARLRSRHSALFMAAASFGAYIAATLVLWYGGHLVIEGALSVGELSSFLMYSLLVAFSLGSLADLWADFMRASGAAERVFELLDRAPAIPSGAGERPAGLEGRVEFSHVSFRYPTRPDVGVLHDVSLTLAPDEVVAVVGPSGAGKSTLAALLARLYDPDAGAVRVDGRDVRTLDPDWLRGHVGVVSQEPLLFAASVAENIRYGRPGASDADVEAAARAAHAHGFVTAFPEGYATRVGERGVQLSGGQKQRIAIARALLKDPRLLVLDEATSALDAESEHLVKDALERLMRGRTTLVIAHRLSTVADASRVVVLEAGRVVQSGTHAALLRQDGLYRRLVERQFVAA